MKTAQLVVRKVRSFVREVVWALKTAKAEQICSFSSKYRFVISVVALELKGRKAAEAWLEETCMMARRLWEQEFSTPDGLDWLEIDLDENGHKWQKRQVEMVTSWLQAHGRW